VKGRARADSLESLEIMALIADGETRDREMPMPRKENESLRDCSGGDIGEEPKSCFSRSSSCSSLNIAASIFTSMQELEASGRNLSSLASVHKQSS